MSTILRKWQEPKEQFEHTCPGTKEPTLYSTDSKFWSQHDESGSFFLLDGAIRGKFLHCPLCGEKLVIA